MKLTARPYQIEAVEAVQIGKANLLTLPMRSGKSYIMSLIINKYEFKRVLIIVGFRKIAIQLQSYFTTDHTFIISGKPFNHTKRVHLATFQTYNNRDINIDEYDCIIVDEYHSRLSKRVTDLVFKSDVTTILLTGTPLTNQNRLITQHIDHHIQPTSVRELLANNWLAPTRFMTNKNITSNLTAKSGQDYNEEDIRQIVKKEDLLKDIINLIAKDNLATEHKTLVYVNFIATAIELHELLSSIYEHVYIVHSKMTNKQQEQALVNYQECDNGVVISVRSISLGFDSPTSDRLIYSIFTVRHALALQILWRASTINPANPNKVAKVYDMIGQLATVNPYTDFSEYSKKKTCKQECEEITDSVERYFCMEACKTPPILIPCIGELSYSNQTNPYVSNYRIVKGKPCKESYPSWEMKFRTEVPPNSVGQVIKYQTCSCGFETCYTVTTQTQPSEMIELYTDEANPEPKNSVIAIVHVGLRQIVSILDDIKKPYYKVVSHSNSHDLYKEATAYFGGASFTLTSNHGMKLPNVTLREDLDSLVDLVNWTPGNTNSGLPKKIAKLRLEQLAKTFGYKNGFSYYFMKGISNEDIKPLIGKLNDPNLDAQGLNRLNKKYNPPTSKPYVPPTNTTTKSPSNIFEAFGIENSEIPF